MNSKITPAEVARQNAGLTLEQAARIARLHPRRLRSYELHGGATDAVARRLCHFYGAGADAFHSLLFGSSEKTPKKSGASASSRKSHATGEDTSVAAPVPTRSRRYSPPRTPVLVTIPATGRLSSESRSEEIE